MIGAGASGIAVAEAARRIGATVVLIEKSRFGGTSLRSGTLALQALAAAANRTALAISSPQRALGASGAIRPMVSSASR